MKSSLILFLTVFLAGVPVYSADTASETKMIFFIDFDDFMCFSCLESFLRFCNELPASFRKNHCLGILVPSSRKNPPENLSIIKKKLRGFTQANRIDFPIIIDRSRIFSQAVEKSSCLWVLKLNERKWQVHHFPLPVRTAEKILK